MLCEIVMKKFQTEVMKTLCTTACSWDNDSWDAQARFRWLHCDDARCWTQTGQTASVLSCLRMVPKTSS